jgi:hypothetical protein
MFLCSRCFRSSLIFLCLCGITQSARCQSPSAQNPKTPMTSYIEEFFLSEAVRNEDPGELQLTFGSDNRRTLGSNLTVEMEYGLTQRLQLSSETPYGLSASTNSEVPQGWSTSSVGLQYQVLRNNSPFALTLGMSFGIPLRHGGDLEVEPELLVAKEFRRAQVHASVVADIEHDTQPTSSSLATSRSPLSTAFQYNLASVYTAARKWFPTLEFNGRRLEGRNAFYLTPGLYRHFAHRFEVGAGVPVGIGGIAGRIGIVGKVTWELGGDKDEPEGRR